MNDDEITKAARQLAPGIPPDRDLWPGIAAAIEKPVRQPGRWTPMLAQAAAVVLLIGASSGVTYMTMKNNSPTTVIASPDRVFEQASFGSRYSLGPGFQDARDALAAELEAELQKVSPQTKAEIETNLKLIHNAIIETSQALESDPENIVLQERLLKMYREELALLRHVSGLARNVMMRNDI